MSKVQINNEGDFLAALSMAADENDFEMLDDVERIVRDWLEDAYTNNMRVNLINSIREKIESSLYA